VAGLAHDGALLGDLPEEPGEDVPVLGCAVGGEEGVGGVELGGDVELPGKLAGEWAWVDVVQEMDGRQMILGDIRTRQAPL
jgi:hypothetical protein